MRTMRLAALAGGLLLIAGTAGGYGYSSNSGLKAGNGNLRYRGHDGHRANLRPQHARVRQPNQLRPNVRTVQLGAQRRPGQYGRGRHSGVRHQHSRSYCKVIKLAAKNFGDRAVRTETPQRLERGRC